MLELLDAAGVQTLIHYPVPPHLQPAYASVRAFDRLPVAESLADEVLSLPIGPHLSGEDAQHVIDATAAARGQE